MTEKYIAIQLIGLCGTALFFISYQFRSNRTLFRVQLASYLLYTFHLCLLGAVTGGASYAINTLRSFCLSSTSKRLKSGKMCMVLCAMQLLCLVLTWEGPLSLLPVAANIASTIAGYSQNGRTIRLVGMLVNSPLWIVYSALSGSIAGIADEAATEISIIVSMIRLRRTDGGGKNVVDRTR